MSLEQVFGGIALAVGTLVFLVVFVVVTAMIEMIRGPQNRVD
jgi:hypothetical protein